MYCPERLPWPRFLARLTQLGPELTISLPRADQCGLAQQPRDRLRPLHRRPGKPSTPIAQVMHFMSQIERVIEGQGGYQDGVRSSKLCVSEPPSCAHRSSAIRRAFKGGQGTVEGAAASAAQR